MRYSANDILSVLDKCCESFTFPMLDNGYVYPAATRLSLYRSPEDWALTIEVFGFSPRSGIPDTQIYTFGSTVVRQKSVDDYVSVQAYETYLARNPNNEPIFIFPVEEGDWIDAENGELLAQGPHQVVLRGENFEAPPPADYARYGILLQEPPRVQVFELCRFLAEIARDSVLATPEERRVSVPAELVQILQLEEWNHPDIVNDELPSSNKTFRSLAEVLVSGDPARYVPGGSPNTHWSNWPDGGTL